MTENEKELIRIFLENDNPEQAVKTFAAIIDFLKQNEASEAQAFVYPLISCEMSR